MSFFATTSIRDSANLDAFSRIRVSAPAALHEAQFTHNLLPYRFEDLSTGTGATAVHDTTNRCALLTFSATPAGGVSALQSYEYFRYQPGRSQLAYLTFNMRGGAANVVKFAGYSDGTNGIEFVVTESDLKFRILSGTDAGAQEVAQATWNMDRLDGTGPSGINLDVTKVQILVIDLQALYAGRVRCGFDIDGMIIYAHEFLHANVTEFPYLQYASLPLRCGMTCAGSATTTMLFLCSAVLSEGGDLVPGGFPHTFETSVTAASGAETHVLSLRPMELFQGLPNRSGLALWSLEVLVTGNYPVSVSISTGQAITGTTTFAPAAPTKSSFEVNTAGTLSGAPDLEIERTFVAASNTVRGSASTKLLQRVPITLDAAGHARLNGTLTVRARGIGGASAIYVALNWLEVR